MTILVHSFYNAQIYHSRLSTLQIKLSANTCEHNEKLWFFLIIKEKYLIGIFCKADALLCRTHKSYFLFKI